MTVNSLSRPKSIHPDPDPDCASCWFSMQPALCNVCCKGARMAVHPTVVICESNARCPGQRCECVSHHVHVHPSLFCGNISLSQCVDLPSIIHLRAMFQTLDNRKIVTKPPIISMKKNILTPCFKTCLNPAHLTLVCRDGIVLRYHCTRTVVYLRM